MQIFTLVQQAPWNMQQLEQAYDKHSTYWHGCTSILCLHWLNLVPHIPWNTNTSWHKFLFKKFHHENLIPDNTSFTYRALPFHSTVSVWYYYYSANVSAPILTHSTTQIKHMTVESSLQVPWWANQAIVSHVIKKTQTSKIIISV